MTDFANRLAAERPVMVSVAMKWTNDLALSEDLAQAAILKCWQKRHSYQDGNFRGWVYTVMLHEYRNERRRRIKASADPIEDVVIGAPASQDEAVAARELLRIIESRFSGDRLTMLRMTGEGYEYQDVATACGLAEGTVKSRLSRVRAELRRLA